MIILALYTPDCLSNSYHSITPPDLPPLSDPAFDGVPHPSFPVYRASIYTHTTLEEEIDIASLPSDKYLQKGMKIRLTKKATDDTPELTEEALRKFYRGLVESGREEGVQEGSKSIDAPGGRIRLERARREEVLSRLEARLVGQASSRSYSSKPQTLLPTDATFVPKHHRIALALSSIAGFPSPSANRVFSIKGKEKAKITPCDVPLGLVSRRECDALFEAFVSTCYEAALIQRSNKKMQEGRKHSWKLWL